MSKPWYSRPPQEVLDALECGRNGLAPQEAQRRLAEHGPNRLQEGKRKSVAALFLEQFQDLLVVILLAAAVISALTGNVESTIVIFAVLILNAILGTVQYLKAHLTVATLERDVFTAGIPFLKRLASASDVEVVPFIEGQTEQEGQVTIVTHAAQISIPLGELVDLEKEKARVQKELDKNKKLLTGLQGKLSNPGFVSKAPANVVEAERERAAKLRPVFFISRYSD